ncbi:hypothetical protein [Gynurincola endophyticus]|uniref:hypothetical protein n=1 Tax=Gynurincola endophyticus TaxID=2479004 RepID=UPI000F8D29E6|nr:hypothetical protein [Gynurincola endophyticus]
MERPNQLTTIKIIHTIIWIFYNIVIFYMLYAVITNSIDGYFWIGCGLVMVEGIVLLCFKWTCPLSILARRYTDDTNDNFDIYLPNWLARNTKTIYTGLFILIVAILFYRIFS